MCVANMCGVVSLLILPWYSTNWLQNIHFFFVSVFKLFRLLLDSSIKHTTTSWHEVCYVSLEAPMGNHLGLPFIFSAKICWVCSCALVGVSGLFWQSMNDYGANSFLNCCLFVLLHISFLTCAGAHKCDSLFKYICGQSSSPSWTARPITVSSRVQFGSQVQLW